MLIIFYFHFELFSLFGVDDAEVDGATSDGVIKERSIFSAFSPLFSFVT